MAQTKNIIFDLGGVLLDIDYQKTVDAFKRLGIQDFENMYSQFRADELFEKLETGRISETAFYEAMQERTKINLTMEEINDAWNALILHFRYDSLVFLERLSASYKLYLLSNTNSIHLTCINKLLAQEAGKSGLDEYFIKAWLSNRVGLRKPDAEIFEYVLKDEKLTASETLFIDDTLVNIEAANELGFKTHHFLPSEKVEMLDFSAF